MEQQELRIGNLIEYKKTSIPNNPEKVKAISDQTIVVESAMGVVGDNKDEFRGIPITPEWLDRLGFISEYKVAPAIASWEEYYHPWYSNFIIQLDGTWEYTKDFYVVLSTEKIELKYIHQLQNLFYALNSYELKIS